MPGAKAGIIWLMPRVRDTRPGASGTASGGTFPWRPAGTTSSSCENDTPHLIVTVWPASIQRAAMRVISTPL